ncbi:MAG: hypothetical protein ACP5OR_06725 [Candidatus Dormibacteria bacterium]
MNSRWLGLLMRAVPILCTSWVFVACGTTSPIITPQHPLSTSSQVSDVRAEGIVVVFTREHIELRSRSGTTTSWTLPWGSHVYEARTSTTSMLIQGQCIDLLAAGGKTGMEALVAGNPVVFPTFKTSCGGALPPGAVLHGSRNFYGSLAGLTSYEGKITRVHGENVSVLTRAGDVVQIDIPSDTSITTIIEVPRSHIVQGACVRAGIASSSAHVLSAVTVVPEIPTCSAPTESSSQPVGSTSTPTPS